MSREFRGRRRGEKRRVTRGILLGALLERPVVLNGIVLGRSCDALLDLGAMRVIGLEVLCRDDGRRFLPLGAARIGTTAIEVDSPLLLLDEADRAFYRARGRAFRDVRGTVVVHAGRAVGELADVLVGDEGAVVEVHVQNGTRRELAVDEAVTVAGVRRESRA
jgi:hypothetical protein